MKLYHGTSSKHLSSILKKGIAPRKNKKSNWDSYPSRSDMVYLTSCYAPYFAINSIDKDEKALILEICASKINKNLLHPDEDFIAQVLSQQNNVSIESIHDNIRDNLEDYQSFHKESLEHLGNVCYKGTISPAAITRYCLLDVEINKNISQFALDPCISLLNYKFCNNKYKSIISWLFGDRKDFEISFGSNVEYFKIVESMQPGFSSSMNNIFRDKKGIEVRSV